MKILFNGFKNGIYMNAMESGSSVVLSLPSGLVSVVLSLPSDLVLKMKDKFITYQKSEGFPVVLSLPSDLVLKMKDKFVTYQKSEGF